MEFAEWSPTGIIIAAVMLVSTVVGVWWQQNQRISRIEQDGIKDREAIRAELAAFQLAVARDYVRSDHLTKSEERMLRQIDKLCASVEALRADFQEVVRRLPHEHHREG